jgi:hypothetical protein
MVRFGRDMVRAANETQETRRRFKDERYEREAAVRRRKRDPDPAAEIEADRRLAAEEERIARKHDMIPGWSADEFERDYYQAWRERRRRK